MAHLGRVVVVSSLVLSLAALPSRAATPRIGCSHLDAGPARSAKPIVVCVGTRGARPLVSLSADRGRRWTTKEAVGTPDAFDPLISVLVSPAYDRDRTIYLRYQTFGVFASTDGGATFQPADPQGGGELHDRLNAIDAFGPAVPGVEREAAVAIPRRGPAVLYRGQHVPVAGSGNRQDRGFFQLGHDANSVVLNVSQGADETFATRTRVARCTTELACPGGTTFPASLTMEDFATDPAVAARTAVMLMEQPGGRPSVWATVDSGRTFARNTAFDRTLAAIERRNRQSGRGFAVAVQPGGRTWLVQAGAGAALLLATFDAGRTWREVKHPVFMGARLLAMTDGRLFHAGITFECSMDQGRRWAYACPR